MVKINKNNLATLLLILSITIIIDLMTINRFFPATEGWFLHYSNLMIKGKVIYRDFYMFIPPIYPWMQVLISSISSNTFLVFRIYGLLERLFLIYICYLLLRRFFRNIPIAIGLTISSVVYTANLQDVFYGYYQTCLLMTIICLFLSFKIIDNLENKKKLKIYSLSFGFFVAISFFLKQTTGVLVPIAVVSFLLIYLIKNKNDSIAIICTMITFGIFIITFPILFYLIFNNAFGPFIQQVFLNASSKGSIFIVLFGFIPKLMPASEYMKLFSILLILIGLELFSITKQFKLSQKKYLIIGLYFIKVALFFIIIAISCMHYAYSGNIFNNFYFFIPIIFLVYISINLLMYKYWKTQKNREIIMLILIFMLLIPTLLFINFDNKSSLNYWEFFRYREALFPIIIFVFIFFILTYEIYKFLFTKKSIDIKYILLLVTAFVIMYSHGMSNAIEDHALLLGLAILIIKLLDFKLMSNDEYNIINNFIDSHQIRFSFEFFSKGIKYGITILFCWINIYMVAFQKTHLTYHWWGVVEQPIHYSKYRVYDSHLNGFYLSEETARVYNEIYQIVEQNRRNDDTLYAFPHINYFNVMSNMDSTTFAKVHYFDVCPDDIAIKDSEILKNNKNTFILYLEFSEFTWEFHEKVFRSGKESGQRKIKESLEEMFSDGTYVLLGKYYLPMSDPLYFYGLNDRIYNLD